jgi:hypothetical protein
LTPFSEGEILKASIIKGEINKGAGLILKNLLLFFTHPRSFPQDGRRGELGKEKGGKGGGEDEWELGDREKGRGEVGCRKLGVGEEGDRVKEGREGMR